MAAHIESKDVKAGYYPLSKAIQKVTGSPWSHVGIVFCLDAIDRVLLPESVED